MWSSPSIGIRQLASPSGNPAPFASVITNPNSALRAVKKWLPGSVWSAGGEFRIIETKSHLEKAVDYDLYDQGPGAWTWS